MTKIGSGEIKRHMKREEKGRKRRKKNKGGGGGGGHFAKEERRAQTLCSCPSSLAQTFDNFNNVAMS